ncbi:DUF4148 domain-containing protein [Paraburkholderia sp. J63]|uniref:DUF4148 domain-containing protein n=1 Tax=Paraburkholderia sp. J63 TaxID=2805434 RepID=UPI002ABD360C|nr:DUF4148 domain-containing protein [Paraburkholderia sp. J63]
MKSLIQAVVIATACAAPLAAFAQSDQGLTRDQVRAQLVEFQQAQRNQNAGVTAVNAPVAQGDSSYGGVSNSSSMAGAHYVSEAARTGPQSVYFGGQ